MTNWKAIQNGDGGWAYSRGCSWTEPTVFALLAQSAAAPDRESFQRGVRFLSSIARPDGGWSPQPGVEESTWVTALAVLLPEGAVTEQQRRNAIGWLKTRSGRESGWRYRLQQRLVGNKDDFPEGWPWFPGAAAWVIPTSLGILAFEKALRQNQAAPGELQERIEAGRKYLLEHMCADGGWNHGSNRALGRDGDSYPETTGIALLALNGVASAQIERAKATARKLLASCRAAEGIAWLRMGLAAHGETVAPGSDPVSDPVCRTNMDEALMTLAQAQRNPLLI
jgi:squalene cyclase